MECSNECAELMNICKFELGWCYFTLNNFEEARPLIKEFNHNHKGKTFKAWAHYLLGLSILIKDAERAAKHF